MLSSGVDLAVSSSKRVPPLYRKERGHVNSEYTYLVNSIPISLMRVASMHAT